MMRETDKVSYDEDQHHTYSAHAFMYTCLGYVWAMKYVAKIYLPWKYFFYLKEI